MLRRVDLAPNSTGLNEIRRHHCECVNAKRTVGCCSHVAVVVYYQSRAHHHTRVMTPAEILNSLFNDNGAAALVIDENSDEDRVDALRE